ncbi:hypothetical protein LTR78_007770 [Recurvomyces mirabilis]|uniref:Endoplasmic reticulum-Golgi intermediate compartment protein n=1 Tax=Recurvomyces mirabilis TaxID=574656 RepID=A0AAE0TSR6_9PEZI|nr:hypothetical protein LTR78_007770 [Recurvomyces mirabilis]KAK5151658.1 hypothetical protein LTS14_009145 [Recurvomyces mirabilis]
MNGFVDHGLDDSAFGENKAVSAVKAFDAFPKTKPSYQQKTNTGGVWTVVLICASLWLAWTEVVRYWYGNTSHDFSVEQGVGHDLQINLDVVVKMKCDDLHVNVQDASGDRILAGQALHKDSTTWTQWGLNRKQHTLGATKEERLDLSGFPGFGDYKEYAEEDVHDYLGAARKSKKFLKTPRMSRGVEADSSFNFSHHINELSFGPFYPSLVNPLDNTVAGTEQNFYKFQYYLSVVPTIYTTDAKSLRRISKKQQGESPSSGSDGLEKHPHRYSKNTVFTNQYAVTEQSHPVAENNVPGVFVKFDIEPIQLTIAEEWSSIPALFIRLVNVVSGVLVAGGWCYQISEWAKEMRGRRRGRSESWAGMLTPMDEKKSTF